MSELFGARFIPKGTENDQTKDGGSEPTRASRPFVQRKQRIDKANHREKIKPERERMKSLCIKRVRRNTLRHRSKKHEEQGKVKSLWVCDLFNISKIFLACLAICLRNRLRRWVASENRRRQAKVWTRKEKKSKDAKRWKWLQHHFDLTEKEIVREKERNFRLNKKVPNLCFTWNK